MELLKRFYEEEDGMGTVEIVMIIAALVCIALLFREKMVQFVTNIVNKAFSGEVQSKATEGLE